MSNVINIKLPRYEGFLTILLDRENNDLNINIIYIISNKIQK